MKSLRVRDDSGRGRRRAVWGGRHLVHERSHTSLVLEQFAVARHRTPPEKANRGRSDRDGRPVSLLKKAAHLLPLLAFPMVLSLASCGVARLVNVVPGSPAAVCATSSIRPLVSANIRGTGEVCTTSAAARASMYAEQLTPGGTYTTLLHYQLEPPTICQVPCVLDRGVAARQTARVDTSKADEFGRLQVIQELDAVTVPHGSLAQLVLVEFVPGRAPQLVEFANPTGVRHRVDRFPDADAETPVAEATLQVP